MPQITSVVESNKAKLFELKNMPESGKINGKQIVSEEFVKKKLVKYVQIGSEEDKQAWEEFIESIAIKGETYLYAYVEVEKDNKIQLRCFDWCEDANSKNSKGLFQGSKATKIKEYCFEKSIVYIYDFRGRCGICKYIK